MANITPPAPSNLEELRGKAEELYRTSREYSQPVPEILPLPLPGSEVDPEAVDRIASQAFSSLYKSDKYSDLLIKCQDRVWRAHKAVVCSQSKVLAACVDGPFREAQTGEIDLSDDEPEIVEHMIEYLYKGFYNFESPLETISSGPTKPDWISRIWKTEPNDTTSNQSAASDDITPHYTKPLPSLVASSSHSEPQQQVNGRVAPIPSRLVIHASVYCMADQYDIPILKTFALCKYSILALTAWKSPFFIPSLKLIYDRTPSRLPMIDDLRAVAAKTAADHSQYFLDRVEFLECCTENPEIALDVMRMMMVLKQREYVVAWKPEKVWCQTDKTHELMYLPPLTGFGTGTVGSNGVYSRLMQGLGRSDGGRYKCLRCWRTIPF